MLALDEKPMYLMSHTGKESFDNKSYTRHSWEKGSVTDTIPLQSKSMEPA